MTHPYAKRLIYAADLSIPPESTPQEAYDKAQAMLDATCEKLQGLGVIIKGNTLFRILGIKALIQLQEAGCSIFADYKLFDVIDTCKNDASWLATFGETIAVLTINIDVSKRTIIIVNKMLPQTLIAPVHPLTDLTDTDFKERMMRDPTGKDDRISSVQTFFKRCTTLPCKAVICAPKDLSFAPYGFFSERQMITPGIRPDWVQLNGDNNNANALRHQDAFALGASKVVIGSPLRAQGSLRANVLRVLDEIGHTLAKTNPTV